MKIYVKNNNVGQAYKVLTRKLHREGVFNTIRDNRYFQTKSEKRRTSKNAAIARQRRDNAKIQARLEREDTYIPKNKRNIRPTKN